MRLIKMKGRLVDTAVLQKQSNNAPGPLNPSVSGHHMTRANNNNVGQRTPRAMRQIQQPAQRGNN
jgi:hypothetical protein